jgi:hypothetical protein
MTLKNAPGTPAAETITTASLIGKPVLVTTERRGVFFGFLAEHDPDKRVAVLTNIRCAIRWRTTGGFLELAAKGPNVNSKIGTEAPASRVDLITSITVCTDAAAKAWQEHE